MQDATEELTATLRQAMEYDKKDGAMVSRLKLYVKAINEDVHLLEKEKGDADTTDDAKKAQANALKLARRVRRDMEHRIAEMVALQEAADASTVASGNSSSSDLAPPQETLVKPASGMKLPPIRITPFRGDESKFQGFIDVFEELVSQHPNLSDVAKLTHLKMSLEGKPRELVEDLPDAKATFSTAIKTLKKTYGGKGKALMRVYQKLHDLPVAANDKTSLRWTYAKVSGILESLRHLEHTPDENSYIRAIVLGKFPEDLICKVIEDDPDIKLVEALERLEKYVTARENVARAAVFTAPSSSSRNPPRTSNDQPRTSNDRSRNVASSSSSSANEYSASQSSRNDTEPHRERRDRNRRRRTRNSVPLDEVAERKKICAFCSGDHWPDVCDSYTDIASRRSKLSGRCSRCLKNEHSGDCRVMRRCYYCQAEDHNRALCPKQFKENSPEIADKALFTIETDASPPRSDEKERHPGGGKFLTFRLPIYSPDLTRKLEVRAVIDTASSCTMVTKRVAEVLKLKSDRSAPRTIRVLGDMALKKKIVRTAEISLQPPESERLDVPVYVVESITDELPTPDIVEFKKRNPQLSELQIPENGAGTPIEVLFGTDCLAHLLTLDRSVRASDGYQLLSTVYGWLIFEKESHIRRYPQETVLQIRDDSDLKRMWDLEIIGLKGVEAKEADLEEKALHSFYKTVRFDGERYEVAWPWAEYPPPLSTHYGLAMGRLRSLWRKLSQRKELLQQYHAVIQQQEADGIVEKVSSSRLPEGRVVHYIPHHPVITPDKTTKIRIVFDGSAKLSPKERSLNELILKGTNWLSDVVTMLVRFRKNAKAVVADISKAFHQLAIREEDRDAVRFIWLKNPEKEPTEDNLQIYRFRRVAFGIVASPFLLHAAIHNHLRQEPQEIAKVVGQHMYADNLLVSVPKQKNLPEVYRGAKDVFRRMGMQLAKWASNDRETKGAFEEGDEDSSEFQSVLGLKWKLLLDKLTIKKPNTGKFEGAATKRRVLKQMASLFDPLGLVTPVLLQARIFLRRLWLEGFTWDRQLKEEDESTWNKILRELEAAPTVEIPRRITDFDCDDPEIRVQLHTFTDASLEAYAVVVYLRTVNKKGEASTGIVAAKSRLAPKGKLSVPRLELLALLVGSRFAEYLCTALNLEKEIEKYYWSDSRCVLAWVTSTKLLPAVIDKQIREIRAKEAKEFRYVPTDRNPADIATRGATVPVLKEMNWWRGPEWLQEERNWPEVKKAEELLTEAEEKVLLLEEEEPENLEPAEEPMSPFRINILKFSSLLELLRITSHCIEALCRYYKKRLFGVRGAIDYQVALRVWLRWDQKRALAKNEKFQTADIPVFMGPDGLLRCQSRMKFSSLGDNAKEPILLVQKSHLTRLIIMQAHEDHMHAGTSHTLAAIRRAYWLPNGRRTVFQCLKKECPDCKLNKAKPFDAPQIADLPDFRVTERQLPFSATGMDVFGPLTVRLRDSNATGKAYVLLFTCLRTRAVHLEPMFEMHTSEFLLAFRKFVARRNVPKDVVSDNAPQFRLIDGRLHQIWRKIKSEPSVATYFAEKSINWRFIPPDSPWFGGVYERMVGVTKVAIERTYGAKQFSQRMLEVILAEVEAVLNTRPIGYVDRELETPIITPAMFLQSRFTALPLDLDNLDRVDAVEPMWKLWKTSEELLNQFWQTWSRFYLAELRERRDDIARTYRAQHREPKLGEIVIVAEPNRKRALWKKGVVERLPRSTDGRVRMVQLRYADNSRDLCKVTDVVPLDLVMSLPREAARPLNRQRTGIVVSNEPGSVEVLRPSGAVREHDVQSFDQPIVVELGA